MLAAVGQAAAFDQGREQMKLLAGLELTTKAVERTAEAIGEDIGRREREEIGQALQLDLPVEIGEPIPILYVQMDGTGVPVTRAERGASKRDGQPARTREVKLGCVFTQTTHDAQGYAIRDPDSTTYTGAIESAEEFGQRLYVEAWRRGWSRAKQKVIMGDGAEWIWNLALCRSSISFMRASISGIWPVCSTPATRPGSDNGFCDTSPNSMKAGSRSWLAICAPSTYPLPNWPKPFAPPPTILRKMPHACAIPNFVVGISSSAPGSSKPVARR
jgi:hypothetical protein